jgi:hypothetical protein
VPKIMVIATTGGNKKDISTFSFVDKTVNRSFVTNSTVSPWSPFTGRTASRKDMKQRVLSAERVKESLTSIGGCPTCNATILLNVAAAADAKLQEALFCPVCATNLHENLPSQESVMTLVPESEDEAVNSGKRPPVNPTEEESPETVDTIEEASTQINDEEGDLMRTMRKNYIPVASKKGKNKTKGKDKNKGNKKAKHRTEPEDKSKPAKNADGLGGSKKRKIDSPDTPVNRDITFDAITGAPVTAGVKGEFAVINFAHTNLAKANLAIVPVSSTKAYLIANEVPTLVLRESKASAEIKPLFTKPGKLLEAISAALETKSFDAKDFGAKEVVVKVALPDVLSHELSTAREKLETDHASRVKNMEDKFFDALCTAAVAVNKNTVDKHPNTLKAALIKAMANNGVRQPARLVDAIFAEEGENFLRNIMSYAKDYAGKSRTAQKEIKAFISSAKYNNTEEEVSPDEDVATHLGDTSFGVAAAAVGLNNGNDDHEEPVFTTKSSGVEGSVEYYTGLIKRARR